MQPAVVILIAGRWLAINMGDFGDARSMRDFKASEKTGGFSSLKRPHSRRNPWQPQCGQSTQFSI